MRRQPENGKARRPAGKYYVRVSLIIFLKLALFNENILTILIYKNE